MIGYRKQEKDSKVKRLMNDLIAHAVYMSPIGISCDYDEAEKILNKYFEMKDEDNRK